MLQLNPSALAHTLQDTSYNPVDIMKLKVTQDREDRKLKEKKEYATLSNMYNTYMKVASNDYGVYHDEIMGSFDKAFAPSVSEIKEGKNPIETIKNYAPFFSKVSMYNQIKQDEQKFAAFVNANKFLSPEQKEKAIKERIKTVFYDKGKKRDIEGAARASKNSNINMAQFIGTDAIFKDYLGSVKTHSDVDKLNGGTSTAILYPWQKVDEHGDVVVDFGKDGNVKNSIYNAVMADPDRANKIIYDAKKEAQKLGVADNIGEVEKIKKELVTEMIVAHADEGSKLTFAQTRVYGRTTKTNAYPQTAELQALYDIQIPAANDSNLTPFWGIGKTQSGEGIDISPTLKTLNKHVNEAYLTPDGKWYVSTKQNPLDKSMPKWTVYNTREQMIRGIGSTATQKNLDRFLKTAPKTTTGAPTQKKESQPEPTLDDYKGVVSTEGGKVSSLHVTNNGEISFFLDGSPKTVSSEKEFFETVGKIKKTSSSPVKDID